MSELEGRQLNQYRILKTVGEGGMATVYKAFDTVENKEVALKVLSPYIAQEPKFKARFKQEISVLLEIRHEKIVPVLDYGEVGAYAYIVMPFIEAGTLYQRFSSGPLPVRAAAELLRQLAGALDFAHSHGVVHRDIKPSNILINKKGEALITDFGFARVADQSLSITGSGLIGTPAYMSPEQCKGEEATPLSDQYAFGVMLYQMTTGSLPFKADTPLGVVIKHATEPLPPPREINPDIPRRVEQVLMKALEKDAADRYPSMGAFSQAFQAALMGKSGSRDSVGFDQTTEVFVGFSAKLTKWRIRARSIWKSSRNAFGLVALVLALAIFGYSQFAAQEGGGFELSGTPTALSEDYLATIDALSTLNAPVGGTVLAPGELETLVAGTMSALIATSNALTPSPEVSLSATGQLTASPTSTPTPTQSATTGGPGSTPVPGATATRSKSATPTATVLTTTPSPTQPTSTPTQSLTPTPNCKGPTHPQFPCTETPTTAP
jgi:serine/threonine protein kinase